MNRSIDNNSPLFADNGVETELNSQNQDRFVKMVLHDLQNYLHVIQMEVDLLKLEKRVDIDFGKIIDAVDQASSLIGQARTYCLPEHRTPAKRRSANSWEQMVQELKNILQIQGIHVRWLSDMSFPEGVVDPRHIKNVFERLVEFCNEFVVGGGTLDIEGGLKYEGDRRYFEFRFSVLSLNSADSRRLPIDRRPEVVGGIGKVQGTDEKQPITNFKSDRNRGKASSNRATFTILLDAY